MSVVSENHGGPDAPKLEPAIKHRCAYCGVPLEPGYYVKAKRGDYCFRCRHEAMRQLQGDKVRRDG